MEELSIEEVHQPEQEHEPQEPQDLELWCLIVGMVGTAFPVVVKRVDRVWELQKTIKNEAVEIFGDFNAAQLRVYLARKDNGEWLTPTEVKDLENGDIEPAKSLLDKGHLASMSQLAGIFKDRDANAIHILVPAPLKPSDISVEADISGKRKRSEQSIAGEEAIPVAVEELRQVFDVLGQKKPTEQKLIATSGLSEFWRGYGEFPSSYFVRKEELVLWGLVMRLLSERDKRIVLVGSAGVGKSCFLMLVSFYLAFVEKRKILVYVYPKG
ncbi:Crinkler (CRN) family protein [Phytophthora palmivora]|uniref:Crinkler (CRN) family protein n=1 Tax=Phytophthora palmivora TaxID=4796 RepID=A0A2P4XI26_9STRA|nr:Crinkler (CRN) family protein [Phytophthora palmivora]POM71247.1 Crinkler (CRN) family protein [Phytophthora palmivora]